MPSANNCVVVPTIYMYGHFYRGIYNLVCNNYYCQKLVVHETACFSMHQVAVHTHFF